MIDWEPPSGAPEYEEGAPCFRYDIADFDNGSVPWFMDDDFDYTWYVSDEDQWSGGYSLMSEDIMDD